MDFAIFYFSGTGNTELISKELKKVLEEKNNKVELLSIEDIEETDSLNLTNKIIGFAYPVYKFTFPDNFLKLFPLFNKFGKNINYFQFCTYARFTANVFYDFSKKLTKNNYSLIACKSFKSPSNGISSRLPATDYEYKTVMFFEDSIENKIRDFADEIINNLENKKLIKLSKPGILASIKLKIVKDIEITKYPKLQIDSKKCIVCGLCVNNCPDNNLKMHDDYIEIINERNCLHCLRCMHNCTSNAIRFGELTKGENRYTKKLRNELYEKSKNGHKEKYWTNFDETRMLWRRNTIKYWWKHRNNPEI